MSSLILKVTYLFKSKVFHYFESCMFKKCMQQLIFFHLLLQLSDDLQIDYESYSWKKLDPSLPETKKMVSEYLAWSGDFGGKKFNQGKIFK